MATELAQAYVQIIPSAKGVSESLKKMLGSESKGAGDDAGESIGKALVSKLKTVIAGAGIAAFIKSSLEEGGNLQQSFGGLETIYGDAAEAAKNYAREAASAGISANDYAEQAVSFGAALKQAFGGDTVKAAEAANTAIMDMADNSAKMGTDIASVQNAYQGFAKQNYTMLDNLKLGYGGTKEEMQRLLQDAQKLSGVKYDISNLGDVYDAIHVIQQDLGVTGVAAEEAKTTFTGSFGAMKAAVSNFLANLSLGNSVTADLQVVAASVSDFLFGNLLPMLGNIVVAIPAVISTVVTTVLPQLMQNGLNLLRSLVSGFQGGVPEMLTSAENFVQTAVNGIFSKLPDVIASGAQTASNFIGSVLSYLPQVMDTGYQILANVASGILNNLPQIVAAAGQALGQFLQTVTNNLPQILQKGIEIISKLVAGLIRAIPQVAAAIPQIISAIKNGFSSVDWLSVGTQIIRGIASGISSGARIIMDAAKNAARAAFNAAKNFLGIHSPSRLFRDKVGEQISAGMAEGITLNTGAITKAVTDASGAAIGSVDITAGISSGASVSPGNLSEEPSGNHIVMNIYGAQGQDVRELADIISRRINDVVGRKEAVFA